MKKIAIITRHAVPNYGSLYQAYALQEAIKKINNEPFIVDAEYSYYSADKISKDAMKTSKYKKIPLINVISYLIKYVRYSKPIKIFRIYQKKWLNLSRQYTDKEEFYKNALQSDGIKRGSPPSRLENQPARTGRNRRRNKMEKIKRRKLIGINGDGWRRGIGR